MHFQSEFCNCRFLGALVTECKQAFLIFGIVTVFDVQTFCFNNEDAIETVAVGFVVICLVLLAEFLSNLSEVATEWTRS